MSDDDVNWEYYRGVKIGTEMAAARIAELEAALDSTMLERGQAQEELREVLDNKHDCIVELEAELKDAEAEAEKWVALYKKQTARIAELEAAEDQRVMTARAITNITRDLDAANARVAELEAERDKWQQAANDLFHSSHADNVKLAELEAENVQLVLKHAARIAELEAELSNISDLLGLYDRVHAELEDGKSFHEIDCGLREPGKFTYETWLAYMEQRLINAMRTAILTRPAP